MLVKYPLFSKWIFLNALSTIGDSMFYLALLSYVSQLPNPALGVLIVSLSEIIPQLMQPLFGALADLLNNRINRVIRFGFTRFFLYIFVGIVMFNTPGLRGVVVISVLNLFSDSLGCYSGLTMVPFIKFLVEKDDFPGAMGFQQSIRMTVNLAANYIGTGLIVFFSFGTIAFLNSFTFLVVAIGIKMLSNQFAPYENMLKTETNHISFKKIMLRIKNSFSLIFSSKDLCNLFIVVMTLNGVASAVIPLITIFLSGSPNQQLENLPLTITILETGSFLTLITGTIISANTKRQLSFKLLQYLMSIAYLMFAIGLFVNNFISCAVGVCVAHFFFGMLNPRLQAYVLQIIPVEQLSSVEGSLSIISILIPQFIKTIFILLAGIGGLTISSILISLLIVTIGVVVARQKVVLL